MMTVGQAKQYGEQLIEAGEPNLAGQWFDIADDIRVIGVECFNKNWLRQKELATLNILIEAKERELFNDINFNELD